MAPHAREPRGLVVLRDRSPGPVLATLTEGNALERLLVVSDEALVPEAATVRRPQLSRHLGRAYDVVVLDLRDRLDADAIGCAEGLLRAGGTLVLLLGDTNEPDASLVVSPFTKADVTRHFAARLDRKIAAAGALVRPLGPLSRAQEAEAGTAEQAALVTELSALLLHPQSVLVSLVADRGRGKSSALGLALSEATRSRPLRAMAVSLEGDAPEALLRFAPPKTPFTSAAELLAGSERYEVILLDEAARVPVPLLVRLALAHPDARIVMATTARGYEGTGGGYLLRFLAWARTAGRPLVERTLSAPIRYAAGDPLEHFVRELLLVDAEPSTTPSDAAPIHEILDRARLAQDEKLSSQVFGLLSHAHYRTTPSDLVRILDAPNLAVHVLRASGEVVAASLVAREGGFSHAEAEAIARGDRRVRGHALADTLVSHAQRPEAGALRMLRSVRIATHPALRRNGLARALVEAIHASTPDVDLVGTVFGATASLVTFRRALGYEVVRLGVARGGRSGEPSVVMLRPVTPAATALVRTLREELARELPIQLELLAAEGEVDAGLAAVLGAGLPAPVALAADVVEARVRRYLESAQPSSAAPHALVRFAELHPAAVAALGARDRALVEGRLLQRRGWHEVARLAGLPSVAAATRAMRSAVAALLRASLG